VFLHLSQSLTFEIIRDLQSLTDWEKRNSKTDLTYYDTYLLLMRKLTKNCTAAKIERVALCSWARQVKEEASAVSITQDFCSKQSDSSLFQTGGSKFPTIGASCTCRIGRVWTRTTPRTCVNLSKEYNVHLDIFMT